MSVQELLKVRKPTYRLFMPSVQLGAMAQFWGDLQVEYAYGRGSSSSASTTQPLNYGRVVTTPQHTAFLDYKWNSGYHPKISDIYNDFRTMGIPDISVDLLGYVRPAIVNGTKMILTLEFGKETVHPQDYGKLVVDGIIPKQDLYETVKQTKNILLEQGVSPDTVKRVRYSGLVLHEVVPHKELIYDAYAIIALLEEKMLFMQEIFKRWTLYDYQLKRPSS